MNLFLLVAVAVIGVCWCQSPTATMMMSTPMHTTKRHGHHHGNVTRVHHHHSNVTHVHHTRPPHSTKEPAEKEGYLFSYSPATHNMYMRKGHSCYICTLSAQERIDVHTNGGIKTLEIKLLQMMSIATNTTKAGLTNAELKLCGSHATRFFTIP